MHYVGFSSCDAANGPGMRVSLFVAGCTLGCKGCFNPEAWSFTAGHPFDDAMLDKVLAALADPYIEGFSLLGGDPLEPTLRSDVLSLLEAIRARFQETKTIWVWTGRKYEHLMKEPTAQKILALTDVLIDGPFVQSFRFQTPGHWMGSANQREIYLQKGVPYRIEGGVTQAAAQEREAIACEKERRLYLDGFDPSQCTR